MAQLLYTYGQIRWWTTGLFTFKKKKKFQGKILLHTPLKITLYAYYGYGVHNFHVLFIFLKYVHRLTHEIHDAYK